MSSMWRKAMLYLGLGPDEEYEYEDVSYDAPYGEDPSLDPGAGFGGSAGSAQRFSTTEPAMPSRPLGSVRPLNREQYQPTSAVTVTSGASLDMRAAGTTGTVRPIPVPISAKPHTLSPDSFNEVQEIADRFMTGTPVIMNLQGVDRDLSRRFVDFASGLCYGLSGQMERVANQVYLLTPSNVEISEEDRRYLDEKNH